ncbi:TonB-dependent receptor [Salinisphaera sp. PC39]|uniref:TonB-dependent receptor n=1 Tax=Salinisphaera sp. PC39 TaxID=1304156 RepID=UPI003341585B
MRIHVPGLLLGAALSAALPAAANNDATADTDAMETIVIEALPLGGRGEAEAMHPSTVLADDDLLRRREQSLGKLLAREPGVSSADFGAGVGQPVIRGLGGPRVRVQENGLGSGDVSTLSVDHAVSVDPLGARQVEVLKGPATLLYGSGAIGGVVNTVTDRVPQSAPTRLTGQMDLAYGDDTLDEALARLDLTGGMGDLAWNLQGLTRDTGDYRADDDRRIGNSATDTQTYSGGLSWSGDRGYIGGAVSGFQRDYGIPGEDAVIAMDQDRVDVMGELLDPLPGFERLSVAAAHTDYLHAEGGEAFFENKQTELRLELGHAHAGGWRGAVGLQAIDREFEAYGEEEIFVPPTDTRSLGLFAVEERPLGAWILQAGARVERQEHDASGGNPDRDHTPLSLSLGGLRPLGNGVTLSLSAGRYQRAPATEELYSFGPHEATQTFERGDVDLDEETARHVDLGLRKSDGRLRWSANVFYTNYKDFVYLRSVDRGLNADGTGTPASDGQADRVDEEGDFDPDGELLLLDYAAADADFLGAELEAGYDLLAGPKRLTLRVFGDLVRGELSGGEDLPRITPTRYGAGLDYAGGPWLANLEVLHADRQDRTAPLEDATDGFTDLGAFLGYRLTTGDADTLVYLRGENLLDDEIVRHTSFLDVPQPGRRLTTGINVRF